jgi:hypothetical protein
MERKEWAAKLMLESFDEPDREDAAWITENLMKDELFSEAASNIAGGDPKFVFQLIQIQCEEDDTYAVKLIEKHYTGDEIQKMAKLWWLKSLGKDLEWAGRPEMLLFALKFKIHIVILTNRVGGPQVDGTHGMIDSMKKDIQGLIEEIAEKAPFYETIFLWALDPENPLTPMSLHAQTQHYATLNVIRNKKYLTKTKKNNAFHFDKVLKIPSKGKKKKG